MQSFKKPVFLLLADDDKDDRFFFQEAFKEIKAQTQIECVSDGEQLINYFSNGTSRFPDVLFLDLNLPRKNGLECLQELRNNKALGELIVVIYSTSSSDRDITEAFARGANLYIKKPNDFFSLVRTMSEVMKINWKQNNSRLSKANFVFNPEANHK